MANPFEQFVAQPTAPVVSPPVEPTDANPFAQFTGGVTTIPRKDGAPTRVVMDMGSGDFKDRFKGDAAPAKVGRGAGDAFARGAAKGATFNFYDELRGLIAASGANPDDPATLPALLSGAAKYWSGDTEAAKRYALTKGQQNELDATAEEQHPTASLAGDLTGGLASSMVLPAGGLLKGAALPGRVMEGAKVGAVYGGLNGVGAGEGLDDSVSKGLGGAVVGAVTGGVVNGAVGARVRPNGTTGQEVAAAANRIDVPIARGVTSDSKIVQTGTQSARQIPVLGAKIENALTATNEGLESAVNTGAARLSGTSGTRADVGAASRASIERGIEKADQRADSAFSQVRKAINPDKKIALPGSLVQDIDAIVSRRVAAGETGVPIQGLHNAVELLTRPEGATFNGLQRARSEIGKAIKWDARNGGFITGDLKAAYGTLTDAIEASVRASAKGNPDAAVSLLTRANDLFGKITGETKELSRFLANGSDERIVDRIIAYGSEKAGRGDIAKLNLLRRSMDTQEWQQVAAHALQRLGQNSAGEFSPTFFAKNYNTMSAAAKDLMFGKGGTNTRQWVDDIATVSQRMHDTGKMANHSNTARAAGYTGILAAGTYAWNDPVGAAKSAMATAGIGVPIVALLARPATAASMARWSRAYEYLVTKPSTAALATFNVASRNFAHSISELAGVKVEPSVFLKALQAPATGRAEEQQPQVNGPPGQ